MKKLLLTFALLFTFSVSAQEVPKFLEGAKVTVTLKNGKTYTYNSSEMAVVKRKNLSINLGVQQELADVKQKIKDKKLVKNRKNRVYGLLGHGPSGDLQTSTNGSKYTTSHKKGAVVGIGYQRKITEKVNVGVQVQSNKTTSLSVGLDF